MAKYIPPSFNSTTVRAGLLRAMGFGEPNQVADKVTFHTVSTSSPTGPVDDEGVPFDPADRLIESDSSKAVSCAVEFMDAAGQVIEAGDVKPAKLKITVLNTEYQQIKNWAYVTAGGERYRRDFVEPPIALGSIDVWTLHAKAEDEV